MPNKRITDFNEANYLSASNYYLLYDDSATEDQNADGYVDYNKKVKYKNVCSQVSQSAITWFGTGADGNLSTTGSTTFNTTTDQEVLVKNYKSLTVNAGHTMTVNNRCKGLLIYVGGDCTINGTVTMTGKGAKATGSMAHYVYQAKNYYGNFLPMFSFNSVKIYGSGSGGGGVSTAGRSAGEGYTGGGGGGYLGGSGSAGTSWSGGSGGGAGPSAGNARNYAGAGGNAGPSTSPSGYGGGAGNGAGTATGAGVAGSVGTGGLLIFVVKGTFTLGNNGIISANGTAGGDGPTGGGGGSGGGRIIILYNQGYVNNGGSIQVSGGNGGGTSPTNGGSGGAGSITIKEIGVW